MSVRELELAPRTPDQPEEPERAPDGAPAAARATEVVPTAIAAFLATTATAWTVGGLFAGVLPRVAGIVAALLGAGGVAWSTRTKRPGLWQSLVVPATLVVAVVFATAGGIARGGLGGAVVDAIRGGGPSGSAIPFEAGWRFLLVLFVGMLAAGAASIAIATARPRLAVLLPVPALIGATLVQPKGSMLTSGVPAMALLLGALVAAYGVELAAEGGTGAKFETRRILRGVVAIAGIVVLLMGVSRAEFLFPVPDRERVIPPQLPPDLPPPPDRELFRVRAPNPGPWRLGVLDVYDGQAWRLPPYDPERFVPLGSDGAIPGARAPASSDPTTGRQPQTLETTFEIANLAGPVLPAPAHALRVSAAGASYDPRTQMVRMRDRGIPAGASYTVAAARSPTGAQLARAPAAPPALREFLTAPPAPAGVVAMLANAPEEPLWERLQFARAALYRAAVASGQGKPVAVPPARAAEVLSGRPATPYELTATEALIARWAGVPSRIGYGFFEGDRIEGVRSVRPRHAATWLEVYFEGHGWVPIVGVPPRARPSLDQRQDVNPRIRPTEQLALVLYVPVQLRTVRLLYVVVRFWVMVFLPIVLAIVLAWAFYPGALKGVRSIRRGRWARRAGGRARVAVAYAELRDVATDLNVGTPTMTPLEFQNAIAHDDELGELTWLVSRALWGDLRRDLREEDVEAAEAMARSVTKRLRRAQPAPTRLLAISSRASLREPYTAEVPGIPIPAFRAWRRRARRRLALGAGMLALALIAACAPAPQLGRSSKPSLPARIVPLGLDGVTFRHEPAVERRLQEAGDDSLIDAARVHTFLLDDVVQGYIEVGAFRPGARATQREVRRGVVEGIGGARFRLRRVGALRVYSATVDQREFLLWFPRDGSYFELLVARRDFQNPLGLFAAILEYQGNRTGRIDTSARPLEPPDPRRGLGA